MRILLIGEDEGYINCLIPGVSRDYVVDIAHNADDGAYLNEVNEYDAIVIDYAADKSVPDEIKKNYTGEKQYPPVMVLSDNFGVEEVLYTYNIGADLCLPKKTSNAMLCEGIKTLINRNHSVDNSVIKIGNMGVDLKNKVVKVDGAEIQLRRKEYDILEYLIINRNRVVSKEKLLEHIWASGIYIFSNIIEVHIKHIRDKIEKPYGVKFIKTVRGFGYRIDSVR